MSQPWSVIQQMKRFAGLKGLETFLNCPSIYTEQVGNKGNIYSLSFLNNITVTIPLNM